MNLKVPNIVAVAAVFLLAAFFLLVFALGVAVQRYQLPGYGLLNEVETALRVSVDKTIGELPWYYQQSERTEIIEKYDEREDSSGLNLVTAVGPDSSLILKVMDMGGVTIHEWAVDWFDLWSDAEHLDDAELPKSRPGTHIHGAAILPQGDVVFNFEKLGMVRLSRCGEVQWRLPYRTHHSIFIDEEGFIWTAGQSEDVGARDAYPMHLPPVREPMVVKVSPEGEIVQKISVFDLLAENDQLALLYMRASSIYNTITDDTLHLNDVEVFPSTMEEGVFKHGDIMLSLRNIHTVLVFDPETLNIRFIKVGGFVRQHDPDFIDGNTITVFDNNNIARRGDGQQSRIIEIDARSGNSKLVYTGSEGQPFYTHIMGKHQWLDNGNLLLSDAVSGRGFEVDTDGQIRWEYINLVDDGLVGIVEEVTRLPEEFAEVFAEPCPAL
jgi:hypothetical protein